MARYKSALQEKMEAAKKKRNQPLMVKDVSGQLTAVRPQGSQQYSALTGQQQPLSPLSASNAGLNPDVAKMAGSAQQRQAVLREAIEPQDTLTAARRQQQARSGARMGEQQAKERSQSLEALQGLGDRVSNLIQQRLPVDSSQYVQLQGDEAIQAIIDAPPEGKAQAVANWANAERAAGREPDFSTISTLFDDPTELMAAAAQAGFSGLVEVDDAMITGLGYGGREELEQVIGQPIPEGTTLQEFQQLIENTIADDFDTVEELKRQAFSPYMSSQERAAARQQLADMGAIGLTEAEQQAAAVEDSVAKAGDVKIGGETYSIEQLLDDETVSGIVKRYFEDEDYAEQIKDQLGGFSNWLEQNRESLAEMASEIEDTAAEVADIDKENRALLTPVEGGEALSEGLIEKLIPGYNPAEFAAEQYDYVDSPVISYLQDDTIPSNERAAAVTVLNSLEELNPEMVDSILSDHPDMLTDPEQRKRLGDYIKFKNGDLEPGSDTAYAYNIAFNIYGDDISNFDKIEEHEKRFNVAQSLGLSPASADFINLSPVIKAHPDLFSGGPINEQDLVDLSAKELSLLQKHTDLPQVEGMIQTKQTQWDNILSNKIEPATLESIEIPQAPSTMKVTWGSLGTAADTGDAIDASIKDIKAALKEIDVVPTAFQSQAVRELRQSLRGTLRDAKTQKQKWRSIALQLEDKLYPGVGG